jgi:hypothetical protein
MVTGRYQRADCQDLINNISLCNYYRNIDNIDKQIVIINLPLSNQTITQLEQVRSTILVFAV